MKELNNTLNLAKSVGILIGIVWAVFIINSITPFYNFNHLGIIPRTVRGLAGIICSPFLHASLSHIISNTIPLFVLTFLLFSFYKKYALEVFAILILLSGSLVWLFARSACHIGASGLIYALAAFIVTSGFYSRNIRTSILSIVVIFVYGGLIFGIFPTRFNVSWEGHLFGAISGIFVSYQLFKGKI
ncbi:MAG: rhomboid family intramembrane serine protease [Marinifilaceae bacterium]